MPKKLLTSKIPIKSKMPLRNETILHVNIMLKTRANLQFKIEYINKNSLRSKFETEIEYLKIINDYKYHIHMIHNHTFNQK